MKLYLKISIIGLILIFVACNSNNEELEKAKKENKRLKMEMLQKEKEQKEIEKQKLTEEVTELKKQLLEKEKIETEKEKIEAENNRRKIVKLRLEVDPLKKDGRKWDMSGGPDIFGTVTINDTIINLSSYDNNSELIEEFKNIKIKIGDKIKIKLWDKDFSNDDLICDGSILYSKKGTLKNKIGSAEVEIKIK